MILTSTFPHTVRLRVGTALPTTPINLTDADGNTLDLSSGWTGKLYVASYDVPNTILHTVTVTTGASDPNFPVAFDDTDLADIITAWGRTLPERGYPFRGTPWTFRTADNYAEEWDKVELLMWISPAVTLPA